jgi:hypothetical protein
MTGYLLAAPPLHLALSFLSLMILASPLRVCARKYTDGEVSVQMTL